MNQKELRELIEFLVEKDIAEFEMERGDLKLHVKRGAGTAPVIASAVAPMSVPMVAPPSAPPAAAPSPAATPSAPAPAASDDANLHILKSPMVGTFYGAPSPGAPPFITVGDTVKEGQVLCIIEAMKLMNEIEADATGEIVKMFVSNGAPVEYGMPLFSIRKS